ncbi:hypothetical protein HYG77_09830 [Rhodococcus sp. ZPP]|uniref:hypothetical protein n=1 Tax=Rhodococcus sp. ZPP TaxID=2749906 RepID=UPI001AD888BA|nr:hypothetical protein [Rhodococcus sp. ZPP]QTJ65863.1 hypothetical protein HYG77_09830 [Rhodococcus sp. ZPP]
MSTLKDLQKKARSLQQEREQLLAQRRADAAGDPMMTPTERAAYVANWRKEYDKVFGPKFAEVKSEVAAYARDTKAKAANARPQFDPNSPTDLVRTEQAWRNVVLPQLEKGRTLQAALRNADADAVLGAERFAPAWLQANSPGQSSGVAGMEAGFHANAHNSGGKVTLEDRTVDTSAVGRAVAARFAELAEPAGAAAITEAATIDDVVPAFERFVDVIDTGQGNPMESTIGLHMAMSQNVAADEDSDDES